MSFMLFSGQSFVIVLRFREECEWALPVPSAFFINYLEGQRGGRGGEMVSHDCIQKEFKPPKL